MFTRSCKCAVDVTLSIGDSFVDATVTGTFHPGENMILRFPDGSGCPGSPDEFDIDSVYVNEYYGSVHARRNQSPSWFEVLDTLALEHALENLEDTAEKCIEGIKEWSY